MTLRRRKAYQERACPGGMSSSDIDYRSKIGM